jgi:O-antigen/teichoic acid export membrane protein
VRDRAAQGLFLLGVIVALGYLLLNSADGWADWVVFGVIVLTAYGFAVAVSPKIFARRKRTISRESQPPRPGL